MKTFFFLIFLFCLPKAYTQEYCFEMNGLKYSENVSFETKGEIVKFGVWERGNYETYNAETYLFYGKKVGNKLAITFTGTIPYTISTGSKEVVWTLEKGVLKIPMNQKNYTTKKFENSEVIFSKCKPIEGEDGYQEPKTINTPCSCEAYIIDKDKNGLNVREKGDKNAKIVSVIPFDVNGTIVYINSSNGLGWVLVGNISYMNEKPIKKTGFVFAQKLGTSTSGYEHGGVSLMSQPDINSKILGKIPSEKELIILDCNGAWLKVKYNNLVGWLSFENRCANPNTNCN